MLQLREPLQPARETDRERCRKLNSQQKVWLPPRLFLRLFDLIFRSHCCFTEIVAGILIIDQRLKFGQRGFGRLPHLTQNFNGRQLDVAVLIIQSGLDGLYLRGGMFFQITQRIYGRQSRIGITVPGQLAQNRNCFARVSLYQYIYGK